MKLLQRLNGMPLMLRLLLIFITTTLSLLILLSSAIHFISQANQHQQGITRFFADYSLTLVERIGEPVDYSVANDLAQELDLMISINQAGKVWSSHPKLEDHSIDRLQKVRFKETLYENVELAFRHGNLYVRVNLGNIEFIISNPKDFSQHTVPISAMLLFALMLLVLYVNYRAIKNLFSPIQKLHEGSLQFTQGHLQHRIPVKREDELGKLTQVMNNMAAQIEKMLQAKRQMLLAISHELRTPLTRMKLATELLPEDEQQAPLRRDIKEMETLINEILESERLNSQHRVLNIENIPLNELVTELVVELNLAFYDRVKLSSDDLPMMALDPVRMRLLVRNLIVNALQHSDELIEVTIKLIDSTEANKKVSISVQDQGEGIAQHHLQHLTEPFYRVDDARLRKTGGFGLGLYLCQLIVQAHGGTLNISSEMGEGTCVTVELEIEAGFKSA